MVNEDGRVRGVRLLAASAAVLGGMSATAYGLLIGQSHRARLIIGEPSEPPHNRDGQYGTGSDQAIRFAMLGDSMAAGLGVDSASELPGVLLATWLAEECERPVELTTYAVSGSTTRDLGPQIDQTIEANPDVALIIIGANDVTTRMSISTSAALLREQVRRLREADIGVVVGTCPDLGTILPISQPLRAVAQAWSLRLAAAQRREVERAGGVTVPIADLLASEFRARPLDFFSPDRFHPSAAGYEAAASVLLPPLYAVTQLALAHRNDVGSSRQS